jgi:hypothetical protein
MFTAPQLGLWAGMAPRTDNPDACRPKPPTQALREKLAELRAEFAARAGRK